MEWAQVRALAADGVSESEIARRLGMNWRTVARYVEAEGPPRYSRAAAGSMLDPLEPVLRRLLDEVPDIKAPRVTEILRDEYGYCGSVDLVRKRLARLRPRQVRPAQRTGYRPGQVLQLDWAEMPSRPRVAGRERRIYALVATLPYSGAQTAHFSFDLTSESFLEGHVRIFDWLGGVARECVYDNLRSAVARRDGDQITWNQRFLALRGHYAFHATACTPSTPREKGSVEGGVRYLKTGFWPARRFGCLVPRAARPLRPRRRCAGHDDAAPAAAGEFEAQIRLRALVSPGKRPMTLVRRRTSTKVRSSRFVLRIRLRCSGGQRRCATSASRLSVMTAIADG
jgi:transposase